MRQWYRCAEARLPCQNIPLKPNPHARPESLTASQYTSGLDSLQDLRTYSGWNRGPKTMKHYCNNQWRDLSYSCDGSDKAALNFFSQIWTKCLLLTLPSPALLFTTESHQINHHLCFCNTFGLAVMEYTQEKKKKHKFASSFEGEMNNSRPSLVGWCEH